MYNFKILVCDDSKLVRVQIKKHILSKYNVEIFEALDGQMAVDLYKELKPNVVIMDIVMPVLTGIEALTEIIKIDKDANVIMASSVGTQSFLNKAISAGAIDFLQKPLSESDVHKSIQNFIESR